MVHADSEHRPRPPGGERSRVVSRSKSGLKTLADGVSCVWTAQRSRSVRVAMRIPSNRRACQAAKRSFCLALLVRRARGALTARGTRHKPIHAGSMAASMPPSSPQSVRTPHQTVGWWFIEERSIARDRC
ncbi:hypothetical protein EYC56_03055 [Xanthomonas oryzae]|nr:hypothetical protein EYC54_20525 [Xanthomonas oryzae]QBG98595.1 hypothetical protein EYC56_03055 [Xanthomonas oryzae]QBH05264.1 hypothetical protein EYC57_20495 [Xanthomonas oryzae]